MHLQSNIMPLLNKFNYLTVLHIQVGLNPKIIKYLLKDICISIGWNLISWRSKFFNLDHPNGVEASYSNKLWCDNKVNSLKACVSWKNWTYWGLVSFYSWEDRGKLDSVGYVKTRKQLVDLFTKALIEAQVNYLYNKLGMTNIYAPAWVEYYKRL